MKDEDFERKKSHLKTGYENAQQVIKFIDTKNGALITLSMATLALCGRLLFGQEVLSCSWGWLFSVSILVAVIILGLASITARPPDSQMSTVLFPYIDDKKKVPDAYTDTEFPKLCHEGILAEYHEQIRQVGFILSKKIFWHRWAVKLFVIAILTLSVMTACEIYKKKDISPNKPESQKQVEQKVQN